MADQQIFAFWRIALNWHTDGVSAVFGGPVHTYEARYRNQVAHLIWTEYAGARAVSGRIVQFVKCDRSNW